MRWGVTFSALLVNGVVTMNVFLFTSNLAVLLLCLPIHGLSSLLCARDARIFDLLFLWARTGLVATMRNRAADIHASLSIDSHADAGTEVRVFLPATAEAPGA